MFTLIPAVTNHIIKHWNSQDECGGAKNSQEKLHFPEDFEQIWVRRGMIFVK